MLQDRFCCHSIKMNGYIGKVNDSGSVPPSEVATYVTTKLGQIPKSVLELNVTTNSQHGLTIKWIPLKEDDVYLNQNAAYTYLLQCQSSDPYAKVIRMKVGDVYRTELPYLSYFVDARSLSAITKYCCCLVVVNMVTSLESEETCKNIVTSEQAPSSAPVILCGNSSHVCHSIVNGNKRSIIVLYKLPPPASTNGKIIRNMIYYKTANNDTYDQLLVNGSETQAVIENATTDEDYDVFMTSCNTVDCSAVSNTVRIAAILKKITSWKNYLVIILSVIMSIVVVTGFIIFVLRRHQRRKLIDPLETLSPKFEASYRYPVNDSPNTEYDVIKLDNVNLDSNSNIRRDPSVVVSNPMVTTADAK
ncbi:uncharacterized protein LOC124452800 [Xenia sp. Carnegie-2017]|uniref:uncharacterized protein LOC124452800 n=1 Tax=Xenia sp. Carnegie-2017 TaxID=2897299 RepID=UPI001F0363F7|nr:uncharacterized protein LOC124452800 [Xenia sp. Carnegie-2017]